MIAVSVSRVQSMGSELASAEDRAERQLTEKVATIAEDIIGEILQSRMMLAEIDQAAEVEPLPIEIEETEADQARLKRSLSISGAFTPNELRKLEIARPFLLRRRLVRKAESKGLEMNVLSQHRAPGALRKPSVFEAPGRKPPARKHSAFEPAPRVQPPERRRRNKPSTSNMSDDASCELIPQDAGHRVSTESLQKPRVRRKSLVDFSSGVHAVNIDETRFGAPTADDSHGIVIVDDAKSRQPDTKKLEIDTGVKPKKTGLYKHVKAAMWSSIGMIAYCLLGGLLVSVIESPFELEGRAYKELQHEMFVDSLLTELKLKNPTINSTEEVRELVSNFEEDMINALKSTVPDGEPTWTFVRSWFFSWTVVTAIGYGNYTPVTQLGRVWVMVFGMLGIPLVVLNSMRFGSLFTQLTIVARKRIMFWIRSRMRKKSDESADADDNDSNADYMPPWVAVTLLPAYCAIMAGIFCTWEPWDYFDSFYFTFVTLAGIGLGDIAPSREEVMMLFTVFMMIGLGLFAMFMEMGAMQIIRLGKHIKLCCRPYGKLATSISKRESVQ